MTRESCNLDKDEAEILEPSPSSSSSPSPPPLPPPSLYLKLAEELPTPERPGNPGAAHSGAAILQERKPNEGPQPPVRFINRCSSCRKRVGLTGFRCRCGDLFCARHRYSDAHHCSFDYKAAGREQIAKANPFIRPAKIIKI